MDGHLIVLVGEAPHLALAGEDEDLALGEADQIAADLPDPMGAIGLHALEPHEDPGKQAYNEDAAERLGGGVVQNSSYLASDE